MKFIPYILIFIILSCQSTPSPGNNFKFNDYTNLNTFNFFKALYKNHESIIKTYFKKDYNQFCSELNLNSNDNKTEYQFHLIAFLHILFTSNSAVNGNQSGILKIPYFWHWIKPNPRHEIIFTKKNMLLKLFKPPKGYGKYKTYADIDRLPGIYLTDLLSPKAKYSHPNMGSFYTFGWCSEREMAFIALLKGLGIPYGKVITANNHSWTGVYLRFKTKTNKNIILKVDNTFDELSWRQYTGNLSPKQWLATSTSVYLHTWYQKMAHSQKEHNLLNNFIVPKESARRIEKLVLRYLNR